MYRPPVPAAVGAKQPPQLSAASLQEAALSHGLPLADTQSWSNMQPRVRWQIFAEQNWPVLQAASFVACWQMSSPGTTTQVSVVQATASLQSPAVVQILKQDPWKQRLPLPQLIGVCEQTPFEQASTVQASGSVQFIGSWRHVPAEHVSIVQPSASTQSALVPQDNIWICAGGPSALVTSEEV